MPAVPCEHCRNKMNAEAIVCPHCGKRRSGAEAGLDKVKMSKEELRAIVAIAAPQPEEQRGLVKTMLWPHPDTKGGARAAEIVLTFLALPVILSGVAGVGLRRLVHRTAVGEAEAVLVTSVAGGVWVGFSFGLVAALVQVALVVARGRIRHASSRGRELHVLAKPDRAEVPAALPAAQARMRAPSVPPPDPASPSGSHKVVPVRSSAPQPVQPAPLETGPRLLK